jgi:hypothetical protein
MPPPKLEIKFCRLIHVGIPGALSTTARAGGLLHCREDRSSFHRVLEKTFELFPLSCNKEGIVPGPKPLITWSIAISVHLTSFVEQRLHVLAFLFPITVTQTTISLLLPLL